jgi:hypothetical protein
MKSLCLRDPQPPTIELRRVTKTKQFVQLQTFVPLYQIMDSCRSIQQTKKVKVVSHRKKTLKILTNLT